MIYLAKKLLRTILIVVLPLAVLAVFFVLPGSAGATVQADCTDLGSDGIADNIILVGVSGTNCATDGADDHVEIQYALDNATAGMTVKMIFGTYYITGIGGTVYNQQIPILTMSKNGVIFDGSDSTVKLTADTPHLVIMMKISASNTTLKNIIFDGNKFLLSGGVDNWGWNGGDKLIGVVIKGAGCTNIVLSDITINDMEGDGLIADGISNSSFTNISVSDATHDGISLWRITNTIWNNVIFYINEQRRDGTPQNAGLRINGGNSHDNTFSNFSYKTKQGTHGLSSMQAPVHIAMDNSNSPQANNTFQNFDMTGARVMSCILINDNGNGGIRNGLYFKNFKCDIRAVGSWSAIQITGKWDNLLFDGISISSEATAGGIRFIGSAAGWSDNVTIKNNIITKTKGVGISGGSATNLHIDYNDVWNNASVNYSGSAVRGAHDISADPFFVNPINGADLHLKSENGRWNGVNWVTDSVTSPAINAGDFAAIITNCPSWGCPNVVEMGAYGNTSEASMGFNIVSAPIFYPAAGAYTSAQTVSISSAVSGAVIYYTTDGSTPSIYSSIYSSPINVFSTITIKAMAVKSGLINSVETVAPYVIYTPVLNSIAVSPFSVSINTGFIQQFVATAKDQFNNIMSGVNISWISSNPEVATVNSSGLAIGVGDGVSMITASNGGISGIVSISVATLSGPVGYWKFDDTLGITAIDSSGSGNNGNLVNGPSWTSGKVGGALQFDGVNDYVNAGNNNVLKITGAITLEGWFKFNSLSGTYQLMGKGYNFGGNGNYGYAVGYLANTNDITFDIHNTTTRSSLATSDNSIVSAGIWYHIATVWDGTTDINGEKIYINGVLKKQGTSSISSIGTPDINFLIGVKWIGSLLLPFSGFADEVKVYNRALSSSEVLYDYNAGLNPSPSPAPTSSADLNSDNLVNSVDFGILMSNWNITTKPRADINQDSIVNSVDFGIMMSEWGG